MAAVLVGQFHARDAEGRIYSVHEFQESTPAVDGSGPVTTYKLAIGDRVNKVDDNEFMLDRKSTRLNSSHVEISYAVFCLKKKIKEYQVFEMIGRGEEYDGAGWKSA